MSLYATYIGENFLQHVLDVVYVKDIPPMQVSDTVIYVPNNRLARALQTEILRKFEGGSMLMPQIVPILAQDTETAVFYGGVHTPPVIDSKRRQMWLADAVWAYYQSESLNSISFPMALEYANQLAHLFDDMALYEVALDDVLNCIDSILPNVSENWQIPTTFLRHFHPLWQEYLMEQGLSDVGVYRVACMQYLYGTIDTLQHRVFFVGFNPTYPILQRVLDKVSQMENGVVILPAYAHSPYDVEIQNDPTHPHYILSKYVQDKPLGMFSATPPRHDLYTQVFLPATHTVGWSNLSPTEDFANTRFMTSPTQSDEAMSIALALRHVLETPEKTGALITADRNLSRMVINILKRWNIDIDDSSGTPLHSTPSSVFMQLILQAVQDDFSPSQVLKVLKHPFCTMGQDRKAFLSTVRQLEIVALRGYSIGGGLDGIIQTIKHRLDTKDRYFLSGKSQQEKQNIVQNLVDFIYQIKDMFLPLMEIKDSTLDTLLTAHIQVAEILAGVDRMWLHDDGSMLSSFCADILQLSSAIDQKQNFSLSEYAQTFVSLQREQSIRKPYGLHPRLYIWGTLEGRLQTVDTVIFGGCNEETLPPKPTLGIWMSNQMSSVLGLPTADMAVGISAHDVISACNGETVIFSRCEKKGGTLTIPSRWWQRFKAVSCSKGIETLPCPDVDYVSLASQIDMVDKNISDEVSISMPSPTPPVSARPQKLSMTDLQKWYQDPYQIYAKHILKLNVLEDFTTGMTPSFKGSFIHSILEDFAKKFSTEYFNKQVDLNQDTALGCLEKIAQKHYKKYKNIHDIELKVIPEVKDFATIFIDTFLSRLENTKAMYFEQYASYEVSTPDGNIFTISGVADRIDICHDNTAIVVDYKTGSEINTKDIVSGTIPQLHLQAHMVQNGGYKDISSYQVNSVEYWYTKRKFKKNSYQLTDIPKDISINKLYDFIDRYNIEQTAYYNPHAYSTYNDYAHLFREDEWNTTTHQGDI